MALSEWADWWDSQKQQSEQILTEWVQENPQWWTVGIAAAVQTSMDLGAGMVDVLRLGEGAAEGGWRGYGKDALRLLVVLGPLGRAGGMLSRFAHTGAMRFAVTTQGVTGPCTFTAANNALSIVSGRGRNLFLTAREAAKALGTPLSRVSKDKSGLYELAAWIDELVPFLRTQGARIKSVPNVQTVEQAINVARQENGVVVFAIKYTSTTNEVIHHSVIAVRDGLGRVRFGDYGGKLVGSLDELARNLGYGAPNAQGIRLMTDPSMAGATVFRGMQLTGLMENAMKVMKGGLLVIGGVTAIETAEDGVDLAVPVVAAAAPIPVRQDSVPPEVVKASYDAYKSRRQGRTVIRMPELRISGHRPPRPDWLTGVQYRLNAAGFGAGPVDNVLGPRTDRALRAFQKAYGLQVDGIPGPQTQAKLVEVCGY